MNLEAMVVKRWKGGEEMSVTNLDLRDASDLNRIATALEKLAKALERLMPETNTEAK